MIDKPHNEFNGQTYITDYPLLILLTHDVKLSLLETIKVPALARSGHSWDFHPEAVDVQTQAPEHYTGTTSSDINYDAFMKPKLNNPTIVFLKTVH